MGVSVRNFILNSQRPLPKQWMLVVFASMLCVGCQSEITQVKNDPVASDPIKLAFTSDAPPQATGQTAVTEPPSAVDQAAAVEETAVASQPAQENEAAQLKPEPPAKPPPKTVAKKPIVGSNGTIYQPHLVSKNQTLLVLAAQPDIRSRYLASTVREFTTPEQQRAAEKLAATYDQQYVELLRQRAAILETAVDGADIESQLMEVRIATADLTRRIRTRINLTILNKQQRAEMMRAFKESQKHLGN